MFLQAAFAHMDELKPEKRQNTPHARGNPYMHCVTPQHTCSCIVDFNTALGQ